MQKLLKRFGPQSAEEDEEADDELSEAVVKDPEALEPEFEEIRNTFEEDGPEAFYSTTFEDFRNKYPEFTKSVIDTFIKEMEIRSADELKDKENLEKDWAEGELIIKEDWPCLLDGAETMIKGRGKDNRHHVSWVKIWKKYYTGPDDVEA